ncbi:MAG: 4'-phosphopantetheinyl transferase superfamily protein [Lentimicrobiaceae bacterium]|nr:4'-phosphopantetheinyl transferase superfamily protein [Lentimicrobiaceae bacterium]
MPQFFSEKIDHAGTVYVWKITETEEELLLLRTLSKSEQSHLKLLKNPQKRLHWLAYRALLGEVLGNDFEVNYLEDGKPVLVRPKKFLSVSHSKEFAAVFLSDTHRVGVDIEKISDRIQKLFPRFLNETEQQNSNLSDSSLLHFYWGAKEAVYKMFNQHRLLFAEQIHIDFINREEQTAAANVQIAEFQTKVQVIYRNIEGYMLVCAFFIA